MGLVIDPGLLETLGKDRDIALVTGTNGKTTTTRLLAAAMGGPARVATSGAGANLPYGIAAAISRAEPGQTAVLEVDEGYLPKMAEALQPRAVALLNLSRDQLDRTSEVRMLASRWRECFEAGGESTVVANADDPLVVWGAENAKEVLWVGAGELWHADSVGCPRCEGRIEFAEAGGWACSCGFRRPALDAWLEDGELLTKEGERFDLALSLPGRFNRANAAIAAMAARSMGVDIAVAVSAMQSVVEVEGRFASFDIDGVTARLLLAKNPAGWAELFGLLAESERPLVIGINARIADGRDPSWLWDVSFERLAGRIVVATGERAADLAVRLRHAGVAHQVEQDQMRAMAVAAKLGPFDYVGNYTAFQQLRVALERSKRLRPSTSSFSSTSASARSEPSALDGSERSESLSPAGAVVEEAGEVQERRALSRQRDDGVSALRVVVVHPDLLGTYGDGGNGRILANRALWRGIPAELVLAGSDAPVPEGADIYCLGGGEDGPQVRSAELLRNGVLTRATQAGAAVLAVCAGFQIVGSTYPDATGTLRPGAELIDVSTRKSASKRAVGEVLAEPTEASASVARLPVLCGFENHSGSTSLGTGVSPLASVIRGAGNGGGDTSEGAVAGKVVCTYMHGPVLARNPALADMILSMITGHVLAEIDDLEEELLRAQRLDAVSAGNTRRKVRLQAVAG